MLTIGEISQIDLPHDSCHAERSRSIDIYNRKK